MKKLILITLCCLLLTACDAPAQEGTTGAITPPTTIAVTEAGTTETLIPTEDTTVKFTLYTPSEDAVSFYATEILAEKLDAQTILQELINENVLPADVTVNACELVDTQLNLDLSSAYQELILAQGTAGERMVMGSVVNTFLSAYADSGAETVYITVDGEILESGHVIYDFPQAFYE